MCNPLVSVVILTWNQKDMVLECLNSFLSSSYAHIHYIIVDNASTDGTAEAIRMAHPDVELIISPKNVGVAGGYNLGIEAALTSSAPYVLVTNNDVLVASDMLAALVVLMEEEPNVGMIMPKIYHYYGDQSRLWCTGARWRRFPPSVKMMGTNSRDSQKWSKVQMLDYAPSCTLMIRAQTLTEVGGFDEGFFFYNDDWDFSLRVRQAGYTILFHPNAKLWHRVSVSTQKSEKPKMWWRILGASTVRFYLKHINRATLAVYVVWFVIRELIKLKPNRILPFLQGTREGLRSWQ